MIDRVLELKEYKFVPETNLNNPYITKIIIIKIKYPLTNQSIANDEHVNIAIFFHVFSLSNFSFYPLHVLTIFITKKL